MPTWEDAVKAHNLALKLKADKERVEAEANSSRKCGNCGESVKVNDHFCWNCGHDLEGSWIKECKSCGRLFKTVKPKEREFCNRCEGSMRKEGDQNIPGLFRY